MPIIYLSPSTQKENYYVNGGTEAQYMNLLADELVPYLDASGIRYVRNTPNMTAATSIAASNAGKYDMHLALHSNASAPDNFGQNRGTVVFYYPDSANGKRGAELVAEEIREIYPIPALVKTMESTAIGEVRRVHAPSVFVELAYHDNEDDANWIKNNLDAAARSIAMGVTEYFGIPFFETEENRSGNVDVAWGSLNIRSQPNRTAPILAQAPDGAPLRIINRAGEWYLVDYNGTTGYAMSEYIYLN